MKSKNEKIPKVMFINYRLVRLKYLSFLLRIDKYELEVRGQTKI